jgi:hypothetical protein
MTPPQQTTAAAPPRPLGLPRRVKRGIVAGYIHDISPRHRAPEAVAPVPTSTPVPLAALEPQQA